VCSEAIFCVAYMYTVPVSVTFWDANRCGKVNMSYREIALFVFAG